MIWLKQRIDAANATALATSNRGAALIQALLPAETPKDQVIAITATLGEAVATCVIPVLDHIVAMAAGTTPPPTQSNTKALAQALYAIFDCDTSNTRALFDAFNVTSTDTQPDLTWAAPWTRIGSATTTGTSGVKTPSGREISGAEFLAITGELTQRVAAAYLTAVRRRGRAYNGVAHFHLRNGAALHRVNAFGNLTAAGSKESACVMVNYRYGAQDAEIAERAQAYERAGTIAVEEKVAALLA
jgi:hypothetical protein